MSSKSVVIIGSGLGGLSCGYILAKNGYDVTIVEKNKVIGGCLQNFSREGIKFETGMHYIGSMLPGQVLNTYFSYLNITKDLDLSPLDAEGFDRIDICGKEYRHATGYDRFKSTLLEYFPKEDKALDGYLQMIRSVTDSSPLFSFNHLETSGFIRAENAKQSIDSCLERLTSDRMLQQVLAGNNILYAGTAGVTPLYTHALISDFYIRSAFRIVGGSDAISISLSKSIQKAGGRIISGCAVKKIDFNSEKAVGVTLTNGEKIPADYVISSINPAAFAELTDGTRLIKPIYRQRLMELPQTASVFSVYIKFKKRCVPYENFNYFKFRSGSVWGNDRYSEDEWPKNYVYMHQCTSHNQKYAEGGLLFGYMKYSDVARWSGLKIGHRGADYEEFKAAHAERLLDVLEEDRPGIRSNIENYWTSTPLTYEDYINTREGSIYGVRKDCNSPMVTMVSQRTKVPNLFLTGQSTNSHGALGVTISSVITASELLGRKYLMEQILENVSSQNTI